MQRIEPETVSHNANVVSRWRSRLKVFSKFALRVVTLWVKICSDFDHDLSKQRVNSPAHLANFDLLLQFNFNGTDVEIVTQEIQKQMTARIVMRSSFRRCYGLLAVARERIGK